MKSEHVVVWNQRLFEQASIVFITRLQIYMPIDSPGSRLSTNNEYFPRSDYLTNWFIIQNGALPLIPLLFDDVSERINAAAPSHSCTSDTKFSTIIKRQLSKYGQKTRAHQNYQNALGRPEILRKQLSLLNKAYYRHVRFLMDITLREP